MIRFRGMFEPHEVSTGDGRMFKAGGLRNRDLPLPMLMRTSSGGHDGAETVARITKITNGPGGRWYEGEFLDPDVIPQVKKAVYLAKKKMLRPSVDLDRSFTVEPRDHGMKKIAYFTDGNVIGVTLVPMPAFDQVTFEIIEDDEEEAALVASIMAEFAAGNRFWDTLPIAPRDYKFDADSAVSRIAAWSGVGTQQADTNKYASMFLWRGGNQTGTTLAQEDFRLPIGDVINGQPYLIFHAIYAAAALLSGGHGGLPNIPDADKSQLKLTINEIYPKLAKHFNDPQMQSPFATGGQMSAEADHFAKMVEPYGDVEYADPGYRDGQKRYPIDTEEHVRAAWSYINQAQNSGQYDTEQLKAIRSKIIAAAKKFGITIAENEMSLAASPSAADVPMDHVGGDGIQSFATGALPRREVFEDPRLKKATPLTVTEDGRVFGHLGKWGECHLGIGDRCVMLPKSRTDYSLFKTGSVLTDVGETIRVGKITVGTGHAHPHYGIVPSREHYDNSGWCAAVVNVGEDQFGVWVAGVVTDREKIPELRRSPLSGDWRRYQGNLELVAALAVNNPGFPVFHMEESEDFSLVAAGMVEWETGGVRGRDVTAPVPASMQGFTLIDMDEVAEEVAADLVEFSKPRATRWDQIKAAAEERAQRARANRLRRMGQFADMGAPQQPTSAPMPAGGASPAGQAPTEGQDLDGDGVPDPDADPSTPGIAEAEDPGRATLLPRMADNKFMIVNEETGELEEPGPFLYAEAQDSAQPNEEAPQQQPAAQPQPQAQPQQAPAPVAQPPQG